MCDKTVILDKINFTTADSRGDINLKLITY
jgi:hypothetical protein